MQTTLLILALSVDLFLACVACGTERIKIEIRTALCISFVCSGVLFLSLAVGKMFEGMLKDRYVSILGFLVLFILGVWKLLEYSVRKYIRKHKFLCKRVKVTFSQLNFILSIYNNPVMADKDHSKTMSVTEGFFFALAMSLDGLVGGLGAAVLGIQIYETVFWNFLLGVAAVWTGSLVGRRTAAKEEMDVSWVGGVLFLILALGKVL